MNEHSPTAPAIPLFEDRVVKVVRGREASTKAKMEAEGWEFVSQATATLRTEMTFRRARPKGPLAYLTGGWAKFRTLPPKVQTATGAAAGLAVAALIVAVAVSSNGAESTPTAGSSSAASSSTAATPPSNKGASAPTTTDTSPTTTSATGKPITVKNNMEFAALAKDGDYCSDQIAAFAGKYEGRTVEFDGSVSAMNTHDNYKSRYDVLVSMGPKGSEATLGPAFQFNNVGIVDLHLTGRTPNTVGLDDRLHIVAEVGEFSAQHGCLFQLNPISTEVR
ncbi:DUF4839 domain-containing protein [Pedococcus sp. P5_B7]